jgi:hypothetical protein
MKLVGNVARIGEMRNAFRILIAKPEMKRPLERRKSRCKNNIRIDIREIGSKFVDWMHLIQDRNQ